VKSPSNRPLAGIGFAVLAAACFSCLDTTTKSISASMSLLTALWFRYAFQAVLTTALVWKGQGWQLFVTRHPRFQLARGVLLFFSSLLAFFSLKYMPVGEFTAIVLMAPLVITLLAAWTLKERVSPMRWALVCGGFVGTLVIIRPDTQHFDWTLLLPLVLVVTNSGFQVLTGKLAREREAPMTTHVLTGWTGTTLATLMLPFVWQMPPDGWVWMQLMLMGVLATLGHFFLILAYERTPAATLTPYMYTQIGFAALAGWIVFSHIPDRWTLMGMGLVALCGAVGAWLTLRESRVRVELPES
jgi:drug/metabolite transporter (DMT)-like permease